MQHVVLLSPFIAKQYSMLYCIVDSQLLLCQPEREVRLVCGLVATETAAAVGQLAAKRTVVSPRTVSRQALGSGQRDKRFSTSLHHSLHHYSSILYYTCITYIQTLILILEHFLLDCSPRCGCGKIFTIIYFAVLSIGIKIKVAQNV